MKNKYLSYTKAGVNYDLMDFLKRLAQVEGKKTVKNLDLGFKEEELSRGESAYVFHKGDLYFASVIEDLGTKSLVADQMYKILSKTFYDNLAQDTVAMIVNDIVVVGAKPLVILAYWAAGNSNWFKDKKRIEDLIVGWRKACDLSGAVWGGGETPVLKGIINKDTFDLAGACFGIIEPASRLTLGEKLNPKDTIILLESSGIHANGLSLARKIAETLPEKYLTKISDGRFYGEALLDPTIIYSKLIQELFEKRIDIHYMVNITGHGWRKLMRAKKSFTYRIKNVPPIPPVLKFMIEKGPLKEKEAYGTLNMGAGFAIFVSKNDVEKVLTISKQNKIKAFPYGIVEKGAKQVIIEPKNLIFEEESLKVRA